jgi:hypothetical protein
VTQDCAQGLLQELGWRFVPVDAATVDIQAGAPCDRANLADARGRAIWSFASRGISMTWRVPGSTTPCSSTRPPSVPTGLRWVRPRVARSIDWRQSGYRFSAVQLGWIGFGPTGSARDGWKPIASFGRGYQPRGTNSRAIEAFFSGQVRSECGVGRQVAQYATQAELYGPRAFDAAFDADEIVIGTFNRLRPSRSILLGTSAGRMTHDGRAVAASDRGAPGLHGPAGFHLPRVRPQHAGRPQQPGGKLRRIRRQRGRRRGVAPPWGLRVLQRPQSHDLVAGALTSGAQVAALLRTPAARARPRPARRAARGGTRHAGAAGCRVADPFYGGFAIYVHRQGVKPVGFHIARLLDRNPRTPFRIELGLHNLHTTLYDRYVAYRLEECGRTRLQASALPDR